MTWLAGKLARLVLGLVGMSLLVAASLFIVAAWLSTYPVLRMSPRQRQLRAGLDLATALAVMVAAIRPELGDDLEPVTGDTESTPNDA